MGNSKCIQMYSNVSPLSFSLREHLESSAPLSPGGILGGDKRQSEIHLRSQVNYPWVLKPLAVERRRRPRAAKPVF